MIPYSTLAFFMIMVIYIAFIIINKQISLIDYKYVLAIANVFFLAFVFPQPYHFALLICYSFVVTYLCTQVFKFEKKISSEGVIINLIGFVFNMFLVNLKEDETIENIKKTINELINDYSELVSDFSHVNNVDLCERCHDQKIQYDRACRGDR